MKKLKIAFLVERFPKLSETFVINQATYLLSEGHHVDIYPVARSGEEKTHSDVKVWHLHRYTHYPPILPTNQFIARIKFAFLIFLNPSLRRIIGVLQSQEFYQNLIPYHQNYLISLLYPFVQKKTFDIIHCHFGPSGLRAVFAKSLGLLNGPVLTTFYGYDITHRSMGNTYYHDLLDHGDKFLVISNYIKEKATALGIEEKKIDKIPIGVNLDEFTPTKRNNKTEKVRLLSVARLVEKKGLYFSISAFSYISKNYPNVEYDIVGDGELREPLKELVDLLGIEGRVQFHGDKTKKEIITFYDRSDIFVLPSITGSDGNTEGQGLVLQEAQAMELPIVSTWHNGIPEGVQDGITGYLVPEKDIQKLADKIELLIKNSQLRQEMGKKGRKFISNNFNNATLGKKLETIYYNAVYVRQRTDLKNQE